jgi:[acyl-carrier-protein] S-malonyltransferase
MGRQLTAGIPAARTLFERANEVLGFDLMGLCLEGPEDRLNQTDISQPALFVCSFAALEKLKTESPQTIENCSMAAGLSLGEYTALCFAGVMSFEDGLRVVRKRGEAMQAASDQSESGMVSALLLDEKQVHEVVEKARGTGGIWIANYLCPGNTVLSGEKSACLKAAELIEQAGGRAIALAVAGAFHTEIMQPAVTELTGILASIEMHSPRIPVVSNVDAEVHSDPDEIRRLLVEQVQNPVLWEKSVRFLLGEGVDHFYEVGPGKVLKGLMRRIDRKMKCDVINDS